MSWPAVKFVDTPATTAAVRLDISTPNAYVSREGFSLGVPTFDGAPESVGVDYGYRSLELTVRVLGTKAAALATQQALARELLRPSNWLLFQLQPTSTPVWFRTWRGQPGDLSLDNVYDETTGSKLPDMWEIQIALTAEPFAYGALETISAVTINNDPAAGTNPLSYQLPTIKGDAPAPLTVNIFPSTTTRMLGIVSVQPFPSSWPGLVAFQTSILTAASSDTSATDVADALYSGGGYRQTTFTGTAAMFPRLSGLLPTTPPAGRYKVLVRVGRSDTSSAFDVRFKLYTASSPGPTVRLEGTSSNSQWATLLDLGELDLPSPTRARADVPFVTLDNYVAPTLELHASRVSGTGNLRWDYVVLVPVRVRDRPASTLLVHAKDTTISLGSPNSRLIVDGETESYAWLDNATGKEQVAPGPLLTGGFPYVTPGMVNVLHFIPHVNRVATVDTTTADVIAMTTSLQFAYRPHYLHLAP